MVANDAVVELFPQLLVPINVPVNDPVNDPVLICVDEDTNPTGSIVGANEAEVAKLAVPKVEPL